MLTGLLGTCNLQHISDRFALSFVKAASSSFSRDVGIQTSLRSDAHSVQGQRQILHLCWRRSVSGWRSYSLYALTQAVIWAECKSCMLVGFFISTWEGRLPGTSASCKHATSGWRLTGLGQMLRKRAVLESE